jgi:D-glycero-D-manno-heptose 1,7-bisphosphate phosphatase
MLFRKAIFIDKDGTLIENVPYNVDPARITLARGAALGLKRLVDDGYLPVMVSNQSGIAFGRFTVDALDEVIERIQELLFAEGTNIYDFYFCPHHPDGTVPEYAVSCACRKPSPGMLVKAALDLRIDLARSWMVGDILHDVEAGNRAGCKTILINNGNETEWDDLNDRKPDFVVADVNEAADVILQPVSPS